MKTAMQELIEELKSKDIAHGMYWIEQPDIFFDKYLKKEKEQIQKAFSDGQETPINHPTFPHYSREEYYNDKYNN